MELRNNKILIADDEALIVRALETLLTKDGFEVVSVTNGIQALDQLVTNNFALLLVDLTLPNIDGIELLAKIKKRGIFTQTIIFTGKVSISSAVEAMKEGAYDYLPKPVEPNRLRTVMSKALEHYHLLLSHKNLEQELRNYTRYDDIIGQSAEMVNVYKFIDVVAHSTANVVITGESGTGKELVARAIHKKGSRAQGPFVAVNCSAFPKEILENELFGHEQGAFTGALKEKPGCFELADKGTLLLDEVCEMPLETQAKILRALEERRFRRLGGKKEIEVDVRVISASNKKLEQAVQEKTLREDIFYRLNVVEIELPPLRERAGDIRLLMKEFLKTFARQNHKQVEEISPQAVEILSHYHWPGNVRELKNTLERAVVMCEGDTIQVRDLPQRIINPGAEKADIQLPLGITIGQAERELILKTLQFMNNNKTRTAQILGISLKTLHNKLNSYQAEKNLS